MVRRDPTLQPRAPRVPRRLAVFDPAEWSVDDTGLPAEIVEAYGSTRARQVMAHQEWSDARRAAGLTRGSGR